MKPFIGNIPRIPLVLFCLVLIATNILCQWQVKFWHFAVTVGLFVYPLSFLILNYVNELKGRDVSRKMICLGFFVSLIPSLIFSTAQITAGSLLAYLMAQLYDVTAYNWLRRKTQGRHLWLRNNASGFVSLLIDTVVFTTVAFVGVLDWSVILSIMYTEYPIKCAYTVFNTAPLYLFVFRARKSKIGDFKNVG
jgi:uncharacterized PurR-regulated membrane protein YhhQ (DUF165 family)